MKNTDATGDKILLETLLSEKNVSRETAERIFSYVQLAGEWNQQLNLTGAKSPQEFIHHHILDCLEAGNEISEEKNFIDVGTGAGLPAIPWALVHPEFSVVGNDVSSKKVAFLHRVKSALQIKNLFVLKRPFEEIASADLPENFGDGFSCVSRGTANPQELLSMASSTALPWRRWFVFSTPGLHEDYLTLAPAYGIETEKVSYSFRPGTQKDNRYGLLTVLKRKQ